MSESNAQKPASARQMAPYTLGAREPGDRGKRGETMEKNPNPFTGGPHAGSKWTLELHFCGEGLRSRRYMLVETEGGGARRRRQFFDSLRAVKEFAGTHGLRIESAKD